MVGGGVVGRKRGTGLSPLGNNFVTIRGRFHSGWGPETSATARSHRADFTHLTAELRYLRRYEYRPAGPQLPRLRGGILARRSDQQRPRRQRVHLLFDLRLVVHRLRRAVARPIARAPQSLRSRPATPL